MKRTLLHIYATAIAVIGIIIGAQATATAIPYWEAAPSPAPYDFTAKMVTVNGVLYALGHNISGGLLVRWNKYQGWQTVGVFANGGGNDLVVRGNEIYVGGHFNSVNGVSAVNLAKYDTVCGTWTAVGDGTTSPVQAIAITDAGDIYIGLHDSAVMGYGGVRSTEQLKMWNGTAWVTVGGGLITSEAATYPGYWGVTALATDGTNIYAGGDFQAGYTGGVFSRYLIKWDGRRHAMDLDGIDFEENPPGTYNWDILTYSIVVCGTNVFAAGSYKYGGIDPLGLVRFSTSGDRLAPCDLYYEDPLVIHHVGFADGRSLVTLNSNVYVTGLFDVVGNYANQTGTSARGIARWTDNGTAEGVWSSLGDGLWLDADDMAGAGYNLAISPNAVYVSGPFDTAGGVYAQSRIARYVMSDELPSPKGKISAGASHTLAVKYDDTVWSWGDNSYGQLGTGNISSRNTPGQVSNLTGFTAVAAGGNHSLALKSDGTVWAWGDNTYGQLGNGSGGSYSNSTPVQVLTGIGSPYYPLTNVAAISAGFSSSYALLSNGIVMSWGANSSGQLGQSGTADTVRALAVTSLGNVTEIAAGYAHCLAVSNGFVYAWGNNIYGQIGDGTMTSRTTPVLSSLSQGVVSVGAGHSHSFGVYTDGSVWAWGNNNKGQLGDGTTTGSLTPIPNGFYATSIDGGLYYTLATAVGGTVWAWGQNTYGQLGNGNTTDQHSPVQVSCFPLGLTISAGGSHSMGVREDMTVWGWGANGAGTLGDGSNTSRQTPVSVYGGFGL